MDVTGFLCVSLGSSTVHLPEAHAHVLRLVSVVKMAAILEKYTTEEQHSVVHIFVGKRTQRKGDS
jgi:hypothetical protein